MNGHGVKASDLIVNVLNPAGVDTNSIPCRIYLRHHDGYIEVRLRNLSDILEELIDGTMDSSAFRKNDPAEIAKEVSNG